MNKQYYIYIMSNERNTVPYTGFTNNLKRRVREHKYGIKGFTKKYNVTKLVYYELIGNIESTILREKQIKAGSRKKKVDLINSINKDWMDLAIINTSNDRDCHASLRSARNDKSC